MTSNLSTGACILRREAGALTCRPVPGRWRLTVNNCKHRQKNKTFCSESVNPDFVSSLDDIGLTIYGIDKSWIHSRLSGFLSSFANEHSPTRVYALGREMHSLKRSSVCITIHICLLACAFVGCRYFQVIHTHVERESSPSRAQTLFDPVELLLHGSGEYSPAQ